MLLRLSTAAGAPVRREELQMRVKSMEGNRRARWLAWVLVGACLAIVLPGPSFAAPTLETSARLPLHFESNEGQAPQDVTFVARGRGYALLLRRSDALFVLEAGTAAGRPNAAAVLRMRLDGAREGAVAGLDPLETRVSYFVGSDRGRWHENVPTYARVRVAGVYPGIDVVYRGDQRQLEYDLVIAPGADPSAIGIRFENGAVEGDEITGRSATAPRIEVDAAGDLMVHAGDRAIRLPRPLAYQEIDGARRPVPVRFALGAHEPGTPPRIGFEVGAFDGTRTLVIDPLVEYSTYLGGTSVDAGMAIAVGVDGSAYVTGHTTSTDVPHAPHGKAGRNAFVARLHPNGSVAYTVYLGGDGDDQGLGIAVDALGHAYVVGTTDSTNFPTLKGYQTAPGGGTDAFVAALSASGGLLYGTYLGGTGADRGLGIAVDSSKHVYVTGGTESSAFPGTPSGQALGGAADAFVAKLNPALTGAASLVFATYLGGSGADEGRGVAVDTAGHAYVTGVTDSGDFPITPATAFQTSLGGGHDAFVVVLDAGGQAVTYATYLGGSGDDAGLGITVSPTTGIAAVTGSTSSTNFPTTTAGYQRVSGGDVDAFVATVNPLRAGRRSLPYSTYLGGVGRDVGQSVALSSDDFPYVTGLTESTNFPQKKPLGARGAGTEVFVAKLDPGVAGDPSLVYSTYLGGAGSDEGHGIAVDAAGDAYVTGVTGSSPFTGVPAGATLKGTQDAFVTKLTQADLTIVNFEAPVEAVDGAVISVEVTTTNVGGMGAGPSTTRFTLRPSDKTLGPEQPVAVVGGDPGVPALAPGGTFTSGPILLQLPSVTPGVGTVLHFLYAIADGADVIDEALEGNNRRRDKVLMHHAGADFVVGTIDAIGATVQGATIAVRDITKNIGTGAAQPSTTELWLSTTATLGGAVTRLGARAVPALGPKDSPTWFSDVTTAVQMPTPLAAGIYFLVGVANAGAHPAPEGDPTNNVRATSIKVGPDLSVKDVTPQDVGTGGTIDVVDRTQNVLPAPAGPSVTAFYLSKTQDLSGSLGKVGERAIGAFTGAAIVTGQTTLTIPAGLTAGTYWIVARADDRNDVPEALEDNNVVVHDVKLGPDLIVSQVSASPGSTPGTVVVSDTVRNRGTTKAVASTVVFSLMRGTTCGSVVTVLGRRPVGALDPAQDSMATTTLALPATLAAGEYCVKAQADGVGNAVHETDETNNITTSGRFSRP
jgi:hypothetical protein